MVQSTPQRLCKLETMFTHGGWSHAAPWVNHSSLGQAESSLGQPQLPGSTTAPCVNHSSLGQAELSGPIHHATNHLS